MKKLLALILSIAILFAFAACSSKSTETDVDDEVIDTVTSDSSIISDAQDDEAQPEEEEELDKKEEESKETDKETSATSKPQQNTPTNTDKPSTETQQPAPQPEQPSNDKPAPQPVPEPETPQASTLGNTLLGVFKTKAGSGASALEIAESIITSPSIAFAGGAMPVEEGLLSGFNNYEVKGFKSGAMFAPMIGSIPFVGYVFELDNPSDASSFISNLRNNANLRWNICVEAEEMVTGSKGNMVFFVMCPKSLEE